MVGYGENNMAKTNKNSNFSYSVEWNLMTYLQHELNNGIIYENNEEVKKVVENYLTNRIKQIKENLK